jgi:hypothetical protein
MNIFKKIWKSIYGPEFYADLANKNTGFSIGFYVKTILLVSIISAIVISTAVIPLSRIALSDASINSLVELYPADLNLNIKDGVLSTNVIEPYKIGPVFNDSELPKMDSMVVIDTKVTAVSFDSFKQYNTAVLLTKDSAVMMKDGGLQIIPLNSVTGEFNLNRQMIAGFANSATPVLRKLVWFTPLVVYLASFIANLFMLVTFFIFALIIWLVLILLKKSGGYMHAYRVTIHSMTLGVILSSFLGMSWLVSVLLAVIIILINFLKKGNEIPTVIAPNTIVS